MSFLSKVRSAIGFKALDEMKFHGRSFVFFGLDRPTDVKMSADVGDGTASDIIMTPVRWLQRAIQEGHIAISIDDELETDHALVQLINEPNPFYSVDTLLAATVFSLTTQGNAYWMKVGNANGRVSELYWVPDSTMEPKWPDDDNTVFISHYEYTVNGEKIDVDVEDVIHFRDGVDPNNTRKGLSPLRGLLREVWTDNEAAAFTAALMRNGGVPGLIVSPKDATADLTPDQADAAKAKLDTEFTRERRGKPIVMTGPTVVEQFGFSPQQMDLSFVRNVSEERVTAALGVPAAVVGFGAGLDSTKVGATMKELRQLAWYNGVIPLQRVVERTLTKTLLPEMGGRGRVVFNNESVTALAEDENKFVERVTSLVGGGIWTRAEGREATGKDPGPGDDVYLMPFSTMTVPVGETPQSDPDEDPKTYLKHGHTLLEETIAQRDAIEIPAVFERFGNSVDRIRESLQVPMDTELRAYFDRLGSEVETVARDVLSEQRSGAGGEQKTESMDAARITEGLAMLTAERAFRQLFERHYLRVGESMGDLIGETLSLEVGLPDPAARAIIATGGTRAGLIDIREQTRKAIFDALVEGRIEGLAGDNLARSIRDHVESGPWSTPAIRARVIARTETAFATNVATIEGARAIDGVEQMMILDARAGQTDEVCMAMNGVVVTIDEARQLAADEHPNGTRSTVPITPQLAEELSL